jgi:hypothetical protein
MDLANMIRDNNIEFGGFDIEFVSINLIKINEFIQDWGTTHIFY